MPSSSVSHWRTISERWRFERGFPLVQIILQWHHVDNTRTKLLNWVHEKFASETVRSDERRLKSKDQLLHSFGTTLERLDFRRRSFHEPSQCKCYVKFACLKPKLIWVNLQSLLIYLVQCDSGAPVWNGCNSRMNDGGFEMNCRASTTLIVFWF